MIDNRELFEKLAKSLIDYFGRIYLVNMKTNEYHRYYMDDNSCLLIEDRSGDDFFNYIAHGSDQIVFEEDMPLLHTDNLKEKLLSEFQNNNCQSSVYRLMMNGKPVYHAMRLIHKYVDGDEYYIIGVLDVDKIARKQMYIDKKAYTDSLTGAHNKNAYQELEEEYQLLIEKDQELQFGIVVCDVNNLKAINDSMGHQSGDELLQSVYGLLHNTFLHSAIYRVGGDEFVVFLKDKDYEERLDLFDNLRQTVISNQNVSEGPIVATGMSIYEKDTDRNISDVFARADEEMYADKNNLKENVTRLNTDKTEHAKIQKIPAIRKARLDSFFKVFHIASEEGYFYLSDIRYDFSRWDKQIVDNYELPSEYMYNASGIWEQRIHPSDREIYRERVEEIFNGGKDEFELSYRVKGINGNYVPCICKGLMIRNQHGEPEYFGGVLLIREEEAN